MTVKLSAPARRLAYDARRPFGLHARQNEGGLAYICRMNILLNWIFLFILIAMSSHVYGQTVFQDKDDKATAADAILDLKEGVLLVRFASNENKMEALKKSMANAKTRTDSASLERELQRTKEDAARLQTNVIKAMETQFKFCDYAFFFDRDTRAVRQGAGPVYGPDLRTEIKLDPDQSRYIMYTGRTPEMSIDGFVIVDSELETIPRPFPGVISRSGFAAIFGNDEKHIRRLNKKLEKQYANVLEYSVQNNTSGN